MNHFSCSVCVHDICMVTHTAQNFLLRKSKKNCNYQPPEAGVVNEPQLIRCRLGKLTGSGKDGSLSEELAQAAEHILALLAPAGKQALQGRVVVSPLPTSPASADFLLDLERTQISLGLVVGEGNSFFQGKAQHRGFVLL